jgi:signal transduction histidine kinase
LGRVVLLSSVAATAALCAALLLLERGAAPPHELRVHAAAFGATVDPERMRKVPLPHRWLSDCATCRTVWYRFRLPLAEPPRQTQAVYLPAVGQNAAVYLNGRLLGQGGRFPDPMARLGRRPLWVAVPVPLWRAGDNELYVLVGAERPRFGWMPAPALGAESELERRWRLRHALAATVPQGFATAAAMLVLVMGALAYYRRRESAYAVLAAAALTAAVYLFSALVVEPAFDGGLWNGWVVLCAWTAVTAAWLLVARLVDAGRRRAPVRAAAAAAALALPAALAAWLEPSGLAVSAAHAAALGALTLAGVWLAAAGSRSGDGRLAWPGTALAALTAIDLVRLPLQPEALPLLPWALSALLAGAGWLLLVRFVETLNAAELLNVDLEALVRQRTAELQEQFERVRQLERREAIAAERERLMRDMHDGVGGHLVSLLAMIEADRRRPGELAVLVREALDDVRLMIDSLDPVDDDLNAVLAMFRDRLVPRLQRANVELRWDVQPLPAVPGLTPARVLHVLRMLQEAVTNALRHGRARTLAIGARAQEGRVAIEVRDDGIGFDARNAGSGRGLKNLQRRAAELGAELVIDSAPGRGTAVTVELPGA